MRPRHPLVRRLPALAVVAILVGLASACSTEDSSNTVRVYSGRHYDLESAFDEFTEATGIKVEFLFGNDAELRERIEAEGEGTKADVYMTVDAGNLASAAEGGVFQPLDSQVLDDAVPANLRDPDNRWFGLSQRARSIVYDPDEVDPAELSTYEDLADPRWKGRLCLRTGASAYTQSLVASMIAAHGEQQALEIVDGWADNAEILANDVEILDAIASGICDVGITNHYYLARELEDDPEFPVDIFWANQSDRGVHVNISGAGITRYADNPDLGARLIEWLATDGQHAFLAGNHEYPTNPNVAPDELVSRYFPIDFTIDKVSASEFGLLNGEAIQLMDQAGYR